MMKDNGYIIRQISVFIDNRLASLSEMARCLADRNINLRAFSLAESRDFGTARIIVADMDACRDALRSAGYHFIEADVLAVEVADRPGGMAEVLECIADDHIDVEYAYAMIENPTGSAIIILRVNHPGKAVMALSKKNFTLLSREDIARL
jgi:hypothetical protein